jgi:DNA-binding NarL/FixJ family response regulator
MGQTRARSPERVAALRFRVGDDELVLFEVPEVQELLRASALSEAECSVVEGVLGGAKNSEIARARGTSARTVAHQIATAYKKLGVQSRGELAALLLAAAPEPIEARRSRSAKRADPIAVVENAYRLRCDDKAWLTGIAEAARPILRADMGIAGYLYQASSAESMRVWSLIGVDTPRGLREALEVMFAAGAFVPKELVQALRRSVSVSSEEMGEGIYQLPGMREGMGALGIQDFLRLVAEDPSGFGCVINAPLATRGSKTSYDVPQLERVLAHVAGGFRFRRRIERPDAPPANLEELAEAVMDPDGHTLHASGPAQTSSAREVLRENVRAMERARGRLRREDPAAALALWRGLVQGRWSLIEEVDADGKRFILAQPNEAQGPASAQLTPREHQVVSYAALGHSNKLIAYELGLAESTVAMRISRAAKKLGVRSRVDLIRTLWAAQAPREEPR